MERFELNLEDTTKQNYLKIKELDTILKEQLNKATVFKDTFKMIQNEILESMLDVYRQETKKDINE